MTAALVPAADRCPHDGAPLMTVVYVQLPLPILHAGYGGGTEYTDVVCPWCGYTREVGAATVRPPRRS